MVSPHRHLGRMVQVRIVMENLAADESIHGFAEALVLAEEEAGAVVAAESDLVIGGRFK